MRRAKKNPTIAEYLAGLRAERGLSLREAADRCELSHMTIHDVERGQQRPSVPTLLKFASGYGVPFEELFGIVRREAEEKIRKLSAQTKGGKR